MVFGCNWPNCSKQFDDQQKFREHLMDEHLGEQQQKTAATDGNGTTSKQQLAVVSKVDKKQIWLPVETWVDVLSFVSRNKLAQTVSLTNWLFNAISRPRIDEHNKRIVPSLTFSQNRKRKAILKFTNSGMQIPIAQVPPPINILGFEQFNCWYTNGQVLEFMRLIKPILGTNVRLNTPQYVQMSVCVHQLQLCNIIKGNVSNLGTHIHQFKSLNMEFLKTIQFVRLDYIGYCNNINEHFLEWMHSPLDGDKPRYIFVNSMCLVNELAIICKQRLLESIVPVSFVFHFGHFIGEPESFSNENHQTGEQLTLGWYEDEGRSYFMLCRSKIGDDQGWREVMRKMNNPDENHQTKISL